MADRIDEKSGRNALIYKAKCDGVPAVDIARQYGVSSPRIHRICLKEENKMLKSKVFKLEQEIAYLKKEKK